MADGAGQERLKPEEIRFLALEGGGGKGFAFLGAVQVLEDKQVMDRLEGVSGTSAGAITALMLSLGMTSADIERELSTKDFSAFFDPPTEGGSVEQGGLRLVPRPVQYVEQETTACERTMLKGWDPTRTFAGAALGTTITPIVAPFLAPLTGVAGGLAGALGPLLRCLSEEESTLAKVVQSYAWLLSGPGDLNRRIVAAANTLGGLMAPDAKALLDRLLGRLPEYLVFLDRDMGLFSGKTARDYFEELIQRRLREKLGDSAAARLPNLTFGQYRMLKEKLGTRDLLVCGANLSLGRSVLFSWKHTPNFPIADAIRISMSLPIIYKPYIVPEDVPGFPPCGTYADGGLWNNLPFREIGALAADGPPQPPISGAAAQQEQRPLAKALGDRNTLGLRLEIVPPENVLSAQDVITKSFIIAGETRILPDLDPFILILDTTRLSLLQFSPPERDRVIVTKRSRRAMLRYFGEEPPMDSEEEQDELQSQELRSMTLCSTFGGENSPLLPSNTVGRHR